MPQSHVFAFADPYSFQAALRAGDYEVLVKSKGDFHAELTRIDLHRLWMQQSRGSLSWIMRAANDLSRAPIAFLGDPHHAPMQQNGVEVSPGDLIVYRNSINHSRTQGPSHLASMSLTQEDLAVACTAIADRAPMITSDTYVIRPDPASMARLRALHKAAAQLAKTSADIVANPATAKALEQELVHAMVACLTSHTPVEVRSCSRQHTKIIARFEDFLAAKRYEPVYLAEICAAIAASERTLRTCCHEHLGMGPVRYLWLRRMHLARRALLRADRKATVTAIATEYGFWEFGRFAVEYRALFGESPSATLHHPPDLHAKRQIVSISRGG